MSEKEAKECERRPWNELTEKEQKEYLEWVKKVD